MRSSAAFRAASGGFPAGFPVRTSDRTGRRCAHGVQPALGRLLTEHFRKTGNPVQAGRLDLHSDEVDARVAMPADGSVSGCSSAKSIGTADAQFKFSRQPSAGEAPTDFDPSPASRLTWFSIVSVNRIATGMLLPDSAWNPPPPSDPDLGQSARLRPACPPEFARRRAASSPFRDQPAIEQLASSCAAEQLRNWFGNQLLPAICLEASTPSRQSREASALTAAASFGRPPARSASSRRLHRPVRRGMHQSI